jgi:hypothetical protein
MCDKFTLNETKLDLDCHEHFQEIPGDTLSIGYAQREVVGENR